VIVFAKTRHQYDSYRDFWRLVEAARFPTCYLDEIDADSGRTFIFTPMNGEVMPHLQSLGKARSTRIVWWNLERPIGDETHARSLKALEGFIDDIWVSDAWCAERQPLYRFVPMAGHVDFGTRTHKRSFDFCHLSYLWGRRLDCVAELQRLGLRSPPAAWGRVDQDQYVAMSHLMLSLHQYAESPIAAPIRFAVAASYAIPIVSENFAESPYAHGCSFVYATAGMDQIPGLVSRLLKEPGKLAAAGLDLHKRLCVQTDFRRAVEHACL